MTSSKRLWLIALPLFALSFLIGVVVRPTSNHREPVALTTDTTKPPDFTAPHKPNVSESIKTPTPFYSAVASSNSDPIVVTGDSGSTYWVLQDNAALYASKGLNQAIVQRITRATPVTLLHEEDDWAQVQVATGITGWMKCSEINRNPPSDAAGARPGDALTSLQKFFRNLNQHNWASAYDCLSFDFKRDLPYSRFAQGYSNLDQVFMRVVRVQTLSNKTQVFYLEMLCEERPKAKTYKGEYTLVLEHNHWFIAQAHLQEVDPADIDPIAIPSATATRPAFPDPTPEPPEDDLNE